MLLTFLAAVGLDGPLRGDASLHTQNRRQGCQSGDDLIVNACVVQEHYA